MMKNACYFQYFCQNTRNFMFLLLNVFLNLYISFITGLSYTNRRIQKFKKKLARPTLTLQLSGLFEFEIQNLNNWIIQGKK